MHLKRWITGLIAIPFLAFFIYRGGVLFFLLILAGAGVSLWEYYRIVFRDLERSAVAIPVLGGITGFVILAAAFMGAEQRIASVLGLNLMLSGTAAFLQYRHRPGVTELLAKQVQGVLYIPLLLSFLVLTRNSENGVNWIILLLSIVFAGDTAALYAGTFFGRHKLIPSVSPGKTVEGSLGGLAAGLILGSLIKWMLLPTLNWPFTIIMSLTIGICAQAGDLFESLLKRTHRVKDSGGLLPGHGGVLDRIDALLFAAPVAYLFKLLGP